MTWAKFDDRYHDNRKVKKAWRHEPAAIGLHCMAITYSSMHETDGWIDLDWLEEKLPNAKQREKAVRALVSAGLFDTDDGERFQVHDYLKFNPSVVQLAEKRRKDSERKAAARANGQPDPSERSPNGIHADTARNPGGQEVVS